MRITKIVTFPVREDKIACKLKEKSFCYKQCLSFGGGRWVLSVFQTVPCREYRETGAHIVIVVCGGSGTQNLIVAL